jgi:hypothetical protein
MTIKNDQYFTKPAIVDECWRVLDATLSDLGVDRETCRFVEPSVGSGNFILRSRMPVERWSYYDIDPSNIADALAPGLIVHDYLDSVVPAAGPVITVGNPPFGHRSATAVDFVNHAFDSSAIVAFILPIQFDKYLTQQRLRTRIDIIRIHHLPSAAFVTPSGVDVNHLRTGFYVFADHASNTLPDLRIRRRPPTTHPDFLMWQYNATPEAKRYFDRSRYPWDFAVLRQGYGDYSRLIDDEHELDDHRQYMFVRGLSAIASERLRTMDYNALAHLNTSIPGFGKADLVRAYARRWPGTVKQTRALFPDAPRSENASRSPARPTEQPV